MDQVLMNNLQYSAEVAQALRLNGPVVALESTIISHGMPFPQNLEVAIEVEQKVREQGAVPATICIIKGQIQIGLEKNLLEEFASMKDVVKCSRRDIAFVISKKLHGASTVASTMMLARLAGIKVFATGGIGGVHRMAEQTMDVSADLQEFCLSDVTVVSAGAKAILDLPKTLEVLETLGVPVVGYQTDHFPAFYTPSSGLKVPMRVEKAEEIADLMLIRKQLGQPGGILVANPIPATDALDQQFIQTHIEQAILEASNNHIAGKELTPFLLKYLNEKTKGKSQIANKSLVLNNSRVAGEIAVAWSRITF